MPGNILTIDQGNTRTKLVVWNEDGSIIYDKVIFNNPLNRENPLSFSDISRILENNNVSMAFWASSGNLDNHVFSQIREQLNGNAGVISESVELSYNIISSYKGKLGIDRFLGYVGSTELFPFTNLLVVDAGSALTIDVVDSDCRFRGGNISPGYVMRLESLNAKTAHLPMISTNGHVRSFGINTVSAIRSGVVMGMVAEIADSFERAKKTYNVSKIVMTGGDVPLLLPYLEKRGLDIYHDPYLVCRGMFAVKNETKRSPAYLNYTLV